MTPHTPPAVPALDAIRCSADHTGRASFVFCVAQMIQSVKSCYVLAVLSAKTFVAL